MTFPLVIIAGADQALFDALSGTSVNAFAPGGARIALPAPAGLNEAHAAALLAKARVRLKSLPETTPVNTVVLAIAPHGADDAQFRKAFYPFALYNPVEAPDFAKATSMNVRNRLRNELVARLKIEAIEARKRAALVKGVVSKANMSPFVLPVRNFRSKHLDAMLDKVFARIATDPDPQSLLRRAEREFLRRLPYTHPPDSDRRCLSDGRHYFKSPGHQRHGYYQNALDGDHGPTCLLNARSRLGGALAHDFHFDCDPVKRLDRRYLDCHDAACPPKDTHVNIAPSDAIIGDNGRK